MEGSYRHRSASPTAGHRSTRPSGGGGQASPAARSGTTPRRPMSARGSSRRRPLMPSQQQNRRPSIPDTTGSSSRTPISPYGGGTCWNWSDNIEDFAYSSYPREPEASPRFHNRNELPLSARPRLQGNDPPGYGERTPRMPPGGYHGQPPASARGPPPPHSARGGHGGGYHRGDGGIAAPPLSARGPPSGGPAPDGGGACHLSCSSSRPPRQIVQEVVRALAGNGIRHQQVSSFLVRCHAGNGGGAGRGVRFEAEVLQLGRGGGYTLRFSRVSGDVWAYKDICAQLLSDTNL